MRSIADWETRGNILGITDSEIREIKWLSLDEAEELMPYLGKVQELLENHTYYEVEM
ncbi:hypothetical protein J31TS6_20510 [Brevibacillus reuszeri]|uniref:hypothetical protein n=1 Tax=Brevibacillus reuszeri TaxID=54915 RepID=UPI001B0D7887|nr:hypothetical protein [Brevibacillus reuszeri]GIO06023.1 hypothetical protein J31TS6_20510 [Brevibacillus reuszeri]